jgi:hypothetical protein
VGVKGNFPFSSKILLLASASDFIGSQNRKFFHSFLKGRANFLKQLKENFFENLALPNAKAGRL